MPQSILICTRHLFPWPLIAVRRNSAECNDRVERVVHYVYYYYYYFPRSSRDSFIVVNTEYFMHCMYMMELEYNRLISD